MTPSSPLMWPSPHRSFLTNPTSYHSLADHSQTLCLRSVQNGQLLEELSLASHQAQSVRQSNITSFPTNTFQRGQYSEPYLPLIHPLILGLENQILIYTFPG
ncbi:hypothetical protein BLNAU_12993 [Blattamonas nauphoetae]|uniref:Uncharacterized protein n=1 Tax=Blattamonas nauphoetae TaxID=2049346 RepID=A0ABQ9XL82_9EUKA|nr:hypothetical protein BLNAU_12993 [Blattamonas nauphoetae]